MEKVYRDSLNFIEAFMKEHMPHINKDMNNFPEIPKKVFCLSLEACHGMRMFCYGIKDNSITQSYVILRQLSEQISFLWVLSEHKECFENVEKMSKLKIGLLKNDNYSIKESNKLYKEAKKTYKLKINLNDYLEYGWMLMFSDTCGVEKLYELSGFTSMKAWRDMFNALIHNTFSFHQFYEEEQDRIIKESIYIIYTLMETYICSYHNLTGNEFKINNLDGYELFHIMYNKIINHRKQLNGELNISD